jgi:hypothetical protein
MRSASLDVDEFISSRTVFEEFDYLFVSGSAFLRRSDALGHVPAIIANDALLRNSTLYLKVREPFLRNAFPLAALIGEATYSADASIGPIVMSFATLESASRSGRALKSRGSRYGPPDVVQMRDVEKACDDRAFGSPMEYGQNIHAARL